MLKYLRSIDWLAISTSALVLVLSLWFFSLTPHQPKDKQTTTTITDQKIDDGWWNSAAGWTAIFTCLLTISTTGLWWVTHIAANAARTAAEAVPLLERAYVFFNSATSEDIRKSLTLGDTTHTILRVNYSFKNHGRTPAIVKNVKMGAAYVEIGFPKIADAFGGELPAALIIGSDESPPSSEVRGRINGAEYEKAKNGIGHIFFWSRLEYLDVFENHHETGICAEWDFHEDRFIVSKCEELNYHT